jgi:uncharacterized membrane protein YphA (DoxX/SURF4 family)
MNDREGSLLLARLAAAFCALVASLSTATAHVMNSMRGSGVGNASLFTELGGLLLVAIFLLGPGSLMIFMASRARTWPAAVIALTLGIGLAVFTVVTHVAPWDFRHWHGPGSDSAMMSFLWMLIFVWPATIGGLALWAALNGRSKARPPAAQ